MTKILERQAKAVTNRVIADAMNGNSHAQRLVMERISPPLRDRRVPLPDIPKITDAQSAAAAMAVVVNAATNGVITTYEAGSLTSTINTFVTAIEASDLAKRIVELEAMLAKLLGDRNETA